MPFKYRLDECIVCGAKAFEHPETMCCIECGESLINFCTNEECEIDGEIPDLPIDAKQCPFCGSDTTLKRFMQA